ncbi:protein kinase domain-containing protein [Pseudanabaena sp. PCC 6802]|uniref:protein kinase domain-containing protein n=1 Tax=Pseudanabaena sp. PCC 6802 TaxID=118173 RepID=UPI00034C84E0|nr:protein kinase [Pseudanabaena sp. PCC 6802]
MAAIGQILNERYRIIKALGTGGMGLTYIAEDMTLPGSPKYAIKHMHPMHTDPNSISTFRTLFKREVDALRQLSDHDRIPRLIDDFEQEGEFYLVREYIEGYPLRVEMALGNRWTEPQVIQMLKEVLSILSFVHSQGVIHRDVKPDNIIRRQADGKLVLIDFGAVKRLKMQTGTSAPLVTATNVIGTFGYMAAEQGQGRPKLNSDIYSLGIVGIQGLTGMLPSQLQEDEQTGEFVWQHFAKVSPELSAILAKMVKTHFRDRYQSATEVLQALEQISPVLVRAKASFAGEPTLKTPNSVPPNLRISANARYSASSPSENYISQPTVVASQTSEPTIVSESTIVSGQAFDPTEAAAVHSTNAKTAQSPGHSNRSTSPLTPPANIHYSGNAQPLPATPGISQPVSQSGFPPSQPLSSPAKLQRRGLKRLAIAAGALALIAGGTVFGLRVAGFPIVNQILPTPAATKLVDAGGDRKLTIGVITTRNLTKDNYKALEQFLKNEMGNDVGYEISTVSIRGGQQAINEVKQKLANKEWDIAFTFLPTLSIVAQDNGYTYAARSNPERKPSEAVFFVRADSPIQKFDDIVENPSLKIALGNFDSPQAFYIPLFHLYGTALQASYDNSPREISDKVKSGVADVGVGREDSIFRRNSSAPQVRQDRSETASGDRTTSPDVDVPVSPNPGERKPIFRIIKPRNEDIPVPPAGVYISPNLSQPERELVAKTLLKVPADIQKEARYGQGEEPDYTSFRRVANRVNEILKCADYRNEQLSSNQFYPARFYKRNGCS